jgi:hypothetical protein
MRLTYSTARRAAAVGSLALATASGVISLVWADIDVPIGILVICSAAALCNILVLVLRPSEKRDTFLFVLSGLLGGTALGFGGIVAGIAPLVLIWCVLSLLMATFALVRSADSADRAPVNRL